MKVNVYEIDIYSSRGLDTYLCIRYVNPAISQLYLKFNFYMHTRGTVCTVYLVCFDGGLSFYI